MRPAKQRRSIPPSAIARTRPLKRLSIREEYKHEHENEDCGCNMLYCGKVRNAFWHVHSQSVGSLTVTCRQSSRKPRLLSFQAVSRGSTYRCAVGTLSAKRSTSTPSMLSCPPSNASTSDYFRLSWSRMTRARRLCVSTRTRGTGSRAAISGQSRSEKWAAGWPA